MVSYILHIQVKIHLDNFLIVYNIYGQMINNGITIFPQIEDLMDRVR